MSLFILVVLFSFQGANLTPLKMATLLIYHRCTLFVKNLFQWWAWVDSNHRPHAYQACALTRLSYRPIFMERVMGIEPTSSAWKAEVLPLNYTRIQLLKNNSTNNIYPEIYYNLSHY